MAKSRVDGFDLEVTVADGLPRVRVSMNGTVVVDTDRVSLIGLERLPEVFEPSASMAARELEWYWQQQHRLARSESAERRKARETAVVAD